MQSPLWWTLYGKGLMGDFERCVGRRDVDYSSLTPSPPPEISMADRALVGTVRRP